MWIKSYIEYKTKEKAEKYANNNDNLHIFKLELL